MSYKEPPIPPPGVEEQEPIEVTTDTELPSTEDIQPPSVQVQVQEDEPIEKPSIVIPKAKANLPYPSRLAKEKIHEKDDILAAKFMEIFRDLYFELIFADALVHMPKFAPMFKKRSYFPITTNVTIPRRRQIKQNSNIVEPEIRTIVEMADNHTMAQMLQAPIEGYEDAIVVPPINANNFELKQTLINLVQSNQFTDFVVLDFIVDPRVPLILGRPFLSTAHAIINVHEREIILRQDNQSLTLQCGDTPSIKKYKFESLNKVDFIDAGGRDFYSEEIENFLNDDSIPIGVENSVFNMEEDILFLERLLSEEPCPIPPMIPNQTKSSIQEPEHSFSIGYEHFNTTLVTNEVAESSIKNLIPIPHEYEVTSDNGSEFIEPVKDDSSVFTTFPNPLFNDKDDVVVHEEDVPIEESKVHSNPLFDNDEINSNELESHVESTSNHDTMKFDNLDEFFGPLIPIHIAEKERIRREHADYISRMEMLFTINPRPHPTVNANTNVESTHSSLIPIQDNDSQWEEIDIITSTDDVLPPGVENDDDSNGEVNVVEDLCVDNSILNSEHEPFESEESDFDKPSVPLPPTEPPEEELDFEIDFGDEISVVRNTIVEFECLNPRVEFDVSNDENDDYSYFMFVMFVKVLSFLSAESEDMIFDPGISA
nr:hypothetical protein [Tanacetum cinerariifolium]